MTTAMEMIQAGLEMKAKEEAKPLMEATENVHNLLAEFSTTIQKHGEHKALAGLLAFLGQPPPPVAVDMAQKARELRTSLLTLLEVLTPWTGVPVAPEALAAQPFDPQLIVPAPPVSAPVSLSRSLLATDAVGLAMASLPSTVSIPAPPAPVEPLPPSPPPSGPVPAPGPEATAWAQDDLEKRMAGLEAEWAVLSVRKVPDPERDGYLLRALVAEARHIVASVPESDPLHVRGNNLVRRCGGFFRNQNVEGYLFGLALNHTCDNWLDEAKPWRVKIAQLDAPKKEKKVKEPDTTPETVYQWPEWPKLRAQVQKGDVVLVGNVEISDRVVDIRRRFGLETRWHVVTNPGRQVDALIGKISHGNVSLVVMMEGFLEHATTDKITKVCKTQGVPYTNAGKGGIGALGQAFANAEERLA